jgi:hypothetical protein
MAARVDFRLPATVEIDRYAAFSVAPGHSEGDQNAPQCFHESPNDEVERRGVASAPNEADLSQSSTLSLAHRRCGPAIAPTVVRSDHCILGIYRLDHLPH